MDKIRTVIAHDNEEIIKVISNSIAKLKYVEIVGTASDGIETYNKIIELKPEFVFSKYDYSNMSGLELIRKIKEKLNDKFPVFNTIEEIPDNELMEVIHITGNKLNAWVRKPYEVSARDIIKAYRRYGYR